MPFFLILLCYLSLSPLFATSQPSLGAFKDRLVAVVEKKAITENDLHNRFVIYQQISPAYNGKSYADMRAALLDELCLDQVHELLWASATNGRPFEITSEQMASFRSTYPTLACDEAALKSAYTSWVKRDRLAHHMLHNQLQITQEDLFTATQQPMIWQALEAQWSFDLAYSDTPLSEDKARTTARKFVHYPVEKVSASLLQAIHWSELHTWQFFEQDGEYVAFRLNNIQLNNILPYIYEIECIPVENAVKNKPFSLKIQAPNEAPPEIWAVIQALSLGATSQESVIIHGQPCYIRLINDQEPITIALIATKLKETLTHHRAQEKLPSWHAELQKKYFIKVYHP